MKRFFAFILLFTFTNQLLVQATVLGNYYLHLDYYASSLCLEKDNQDSDCNGSCALADDMIQASSQNTNPSHIQIELQDNILFIQDFTANYTCVSTERLVDFVDIKETQHEIDLVVPPPRR